MGTADASTEAGKAPRLHPRLRRCAPPVFALLLPFSLAVAASAATLPAVSVAPASSAATEHGRASQQRPQGYLGIEFHDVSDGQAQALHLKGARGVEVMMIDHDGPAGKAGLRPHDIITAINGQAVDSAAALRRILHDAGAGVLVGMNVLRSGRPMSLTARLADRDAVERDAMQKLAAIDPPASDYPGDRSGFLADSAARTAVPPPAASPSRTQAFLSAVLRTGPFTGLDLQVMGPQLAGFFGAPHGAGLLIQTVQPNSPASAAGLHAGDVILRADGLVMHSMTDWSKHLRAGHGAPVALGILRDKREQTLTLVPDLKRHSALQWPMLGLAAEIPVV